MNATPNNALQRTPAAAPPAPLSFKTFGHGKAVLPSVIAFAVAALACGQQPWLRMESKGGRFAVSMPGRPTDSTKHVNASYGPVEVHISAVSLGDTAFVVMYSDYPSEYLKAQDSKAILDDARDGAVANTQGTLLSELLITRDGNPGRDIKISVAEGKATSQDRLVLVGRRLYQLIVVTTVSRSNSPAIERFRDSFELLPGQSTK